MSKAEVTWGRKLPGGIPEGIATVYVESYHVHC